MAYVLPPNTHIADGISFPNSSQETLDKLKDTSMHEDDIVFLSYPKSGNQWFLTTVAAILAADDLGRFEQEGSNHVTQPLEYKGALEILNTRPRPILMQTHVRYDMLPREVTEKEVKVIHVMRNPKDVAVSFYYFHKLVNFSNVTWEVFLDAFLQGKVLYGSWFDYERRLSKQNLPNFLSVKYEDFHEDPKAMILKLASFVGKHLDDSQINRIAKMVSFQSMRNNPSLDVRHPSFVEEDGNRFLRKGKVGDWKNHFTEEQLDTFHQVYYQFQKETNLEFTFE